MYVLESVSLNHLLCHRLIDEGLVVRDVVQLGGEGVAGLPSGRLAGRDFGHTHVGLLEGKALELGNEEVGECDAEEAETSPEEEYLRAEIGLVLSNEVGCDDGYIGRWVSTMFLGWSFGMFSSVVPTYQ